LARGGLDRQLVLRSETPLRRAVDAKDAKKGRRGGWATADGRGWEEGAGGRNECGTTDGHGWTRMKAGAGSRPSPCAIGVWENRWVRLARRPASRDCSAFGLLDCSEEAGGGLRRTATENCELTTEHFFRLGSFGAGRVGPPGRQEGLRTRVWNRRWTRMGEERPDGEWVDRGHSITREQNTGGGPDRAGGAGRGLAKLSAISDRRSARWKTEG
jgi:hypothetical protein